jgi:hypothetical protein
MCRSYSGKVESQGLKLLRIGRQTGLYRGQGTEATPRQDFVGVIHSLTDFSDDLNYTNCMIRTLQKFVRVLAYALKTQDADIQKPPDCFKDHLDFVSSTSEGMLEYLEQRRNSIQSLMRTVRNPHKNARRC